MKKSKKLMIGLASIVVLASLILIVVVCINRGTITKMENQLKDAAVEYYESDYKFYYPDFLKNYKEFKITLDQLKRLGRDVSVLEEHNCDIMDTYVTFTYKEENSYNTDVHLACQE